MWNPSHRGKRVRHQRICNRWDYRNLVDREPIQIAAAIARLQQGETRTRMSRRGVEDVLARWRWEHTVDRYEEEVQTLLYTREHAALVN
jgi:hypothetical protein